MVNGRRPGLSLVEVAIAMLVLGTGLLSVFALVTRAGAILNSAAAREGAAREAAAVLDSLGAYGAPAAGAATRGRYALRWTAVPDSNRVSRLTVLVTYDAGRGIRADTFRSLAAPWPRVIRHVP